MICSPKMRIKKRKSVPSQRGFRFLCVLDGAQKGATICACCLTLGSGPDEKVARDFTSVPDPSARRFSLWQILVRGGFLGDYGDGGEII